MRIRFGAEIQRLIAFASLHRWLLLCVCASWISLLSLPIPASASVNTLIDSVPMLERHLAPSLLAFLKQQWEFLLFALLVAWSLASSPATAKAPLLCGFVWSCAVMLAALSTSLGHACPAVTCESAS